MHRAFFVLRHRTWFVHLNTYSFSSANVKVLELLRDASALSRATTGVPLPSNLSIALCVSDCVTSVGEHARWTGDEPSSSDSQHDSSGTGSGTGSSSSTTSSSNSYSRGQGVRAEPFLPWRYHVPQNEAVHHQPPRPAGPVFALTACAGSTHIPFPVLMNRSQPADNLEGFDYFKVRIQASASDRESIME